MDYDGKGRPEQYVMTFSGIITLSGNDCIIKGLFSQDGVNCSLTAKGTGLRSVLVFSLQHKTKLERIERREAGCSAPVSLSLDQTTSVIQTCLTPMFSLQIDASAALL